MEVCDQCRNAEGFAIAWASRSRDAAMMIESGPLPLSAECDIPPVYCTDKIRCILAGSARHFVVYQ